MGADHQSRSLSVAARKGDVMVANGICALFKAKSLRFAPDDVMGCVLDRTKASAGDTGSVGADLCELVKKALGAIERCQKRASGRTMTICGHMMISPIIISIAATKGRIPR